MTRQTLFNLSESPDVVLPKVTHIKTRRARKPSEISTLQVDLSDIKIIQKDINMIVLPFFYFSTKGKYEIVEYKFDHDDSRKMTVRAPAGQTVPSTFDYEVLQVLLKFREMIKRQNYSQEIFTCTAWDIAKELNMIYVDKNGKKSLSKKEKDRITESIVKLRSTSYELLKIYNVREHKGNGRFDDRAQDRVVINILDQLESSEDLFGSESTYQIKFNDYFLSSIKNKYHFTYELGKLSSIKVATAKRLFEVIDFRRKQQLEAEFCYKDIAWAIPIRSGYMNRAIINRHLENLKNDAKIIQDFLIDSRKGHFKVFFLEDEKYKYLERTCRESHIPLATSMRPLNTDAGVESEHAAELPFVPNTNDFARQIATILAQYPRNPAIPVESVLAFYDEFQRNAGERSEAKFLRNLVYTLQKAKKSFFSYLHKALRDDYGLGLSFDMAMSQQKSFVSNSETGETPSVQQHRIVWKQVFKELPEDQRNSLRREAEHVLQSTLADVKGNSAQYKMLIRNTMLDIFKAQNKLYGTN